MDNKLRNRSHEIVKRCMISLLVSVLFFIASGYGQSEFYKSEAIGFSKKLDDKSEVFTYKIGDPEGESQLKNSQLKRVMVSSYKSDKYNSKSSLSEVLNSNPNVKELDISRLYSNYNLLDLDLENLKYIDHLKVKVTNDFDFDFDELWTKLDQMESLKYLNVEGTRNTILNCTNGFESILAKLDGLRLYNLIVYCDSPNGSQFPIKTLSLSNIEDGFSSSKSILSYFSSGKVEELIFKSRTESSNEVQEYFKKYSKLKHLDFLCYKEEYFSDVVSYLSKDLETLAIRCILCELPIEGINNLKKLKSLLINMSRNRKSIDFDALRGLTGLEFLSCAIDSIGEHISEFTNLRKLHLAGRYNKLPSSISSLTNLREIYLKAWNLKNIPSGIGTMDQLENLKVESNVLMEIPEEIGNLKNLKELTIDGDLGMLPSSIGDLNELVTLNLTGNQLKALPKSIGKLKNLEALYLGGSENNADKRRGKFWFDHSCFDVDGLPKEVFEIESLRTLDISNTKVSDAQFKSILDMALKHECSQLSIVLSSCGITKLPEEQKYQDLNLSVLDLSKNVISEFPKPFYFAKIGSINLSQNKNFLPVGKDRKSTLIYGYLFGTLKKSDFTIQDSIPWALIDFESEINNPMYDLAYSIDPENTVKLIEEKHQADYSFFNKEYEKSNTLYESSKNRFSRKKENTSITNYTISNYWIRYLIGLRAVNNTDRLLENLVEIENQIDSLANTVDENKRYGLFYAAKVYLGIFYKDLDMEKSKHYSNQAARVLNANKKANTLNFLELCLVSDLNDVFDSYYLDVIINMQIDENAEVILEYLKLVRDIVEGEADQEKISSLEKMISEIDVRQLRWDTSLVEIWSNYLSKDKADKIKSLNRIINPRLEHFPVPLD